MRVNLVFLKRLHDIDPSCGIVAPIRVHLLVRWLGYAFVIWEWPLSTSRCPFIWLGVIRSYMTRFSTVETLSRRTVAFNSTMNFLTEFTVFLFVTCSDLYSSWITFFYFLGIAFALLNFFVVLTFLALLSFKTFSTRIVLWYMSWYFVKTCDDKPFRISISRPSSNRSTFLYSASTRCLPNRLSSVNLAPYSITVILPCSKLENSNSLTLCTSVG